jgi:hypothetical protein
MTVTQGGVRHDVSVQVNTVEDLLAMRVPLMVPDYQRPIVWDADIAQQVFDDAASLTENTRFFGGVLLDLEDTDSARSATVWCTDGQQRLCWANLSAAALAEKFEQLGALERADTIRRDLLQCPSRSGHERMLYLGDLDDDAFQKLIENIHADVDRPNLNRMADAIVAEVDERVNTLNDAEELYNKLFRQHIVSVTQLGTDQDANDVFGSVNSGKRRKQLTSLDLAWSDIVQYAKDNSSVDFSEVQDQWNRLRRVTQNIDVEAAVRDSIMADNMIETRQKLTKQDLQARIWSIVTTELPSAGIDLEDWVAHLADLAETYTGIVNANIEYTGSKLVDDELSRHAANYNSINATPPRILMLGALVRGRPADEVRRLAVLAEKLAFARRVTGKKMPQELRQYLKVLHGGTGFPSAFDQSDVVAAAAEILRKKLPNQAAFSEEIERNDWGRGEKTRYVLAVLEHEHFRPPRSRHDGFGGPLLGEPDHIAPYSAYRCLKYARWAHRLDGTEEEFEHLRDRLGNLTLLDAPANHKAGTDPYLEKRDKYYADHSDFAMTARLADEYDSEWSLSNIRERSRELAEIAADIWWF